MRTKKLFYNIIVNIVLQIIHFIVGIILPSLIIREYGSSINGLISSATQFIGYFTYIEVGISSSLIYLLVKKIVNKQTDDINCLLAFSKKTYIKYGIIYFVLVVCFSVIYPLSISYQGTTSLFESLLIVFIVSFSGFVDFITLAKYKVLLSADQKNYVIGLTTLIALIINFLITYLFIKLKLSPVIIKLPSVFVVFIRSILLRIYVKRKYPEITYKSNDEFRIEKTANADAILFQISNSITIAAPVILVSFISLSTASIFSVYNIIFSGITGIIAIFTTGSSAIFSDIMAREEKETLKNSFEMISFLIFIIISVLFSITVITLPSFISIYTKNFDENYFNNNLIFLFVCWAVLQNAKIPFTTLINAAGIYNKIKIVSIIQIFLLFVFGIPMMFLWNYYGVLIAMIVSSFFGLVSYIVLTHKHVYEYDKTSTFLRLVRSAISIVAIYFLYIAVNNQYEIATYSQWFVFALIIGISSLLIVMVINIIFDFSCFKKSINHLFKVFKNLLHIPNK